MSHLLAHTLEFDTCGPKWGYKVFCKSKAPNLHKGPFSAQHFLAHTLEFATCDVDLLWVDALEHGTVLGICYMHGPLWSPIRTIAVHTEWIG